MTKRTWHRKIMILLPFLVLGHPVPENKSSTGVTLGCVITGFCASAAVVGGLFLNQLFKNQRILQEAASQTAEVVSCNYEGNEDVKVCGPELLKLWKERTILPEVQCSFVVPEALPPNAKLGGTLKSKELGLVQIILDEGNYGKRVIALIPGYSTTSCRL